jgi:hypothetical protein
MASGTPWPVPLLFGLIFLPVGLAVGWKALGQFGRAYRLVTTEVVDAVDVSAGGTAAVEGEVRPRVEDPDAGALFEPDAVFCYTEVRRERPGNHDGPGGKWDTFHWNYEGVPFDIEDATGTVGVHPPDCPPGRRDSVPEMEVDLPTRGTNTGPGQPTPPEVEAYVERVDGLRHDPDEATLRFRQAVLVPGQEAFVLGAATTGESGPPTEPVIDGPASPGRFAVSDDSGGTPLKNAAFGLILSLFGLVSTGFGLLMFYLLATRALGF